MSLSPSNKRTTPSSPSLQPSIQIAAQRLEYLYRRRSIGIRKKSRFEVFIYWFKSEKSSIEILSKTTTLKDISITARRLLLPPSSSSSSSSKLHGENDVGVYDRKELLLQWMHSDKIKDKTKKSAVKPMKKSTTPKRLQKRNGPYKNSSISPSSSNITKIRFKNSSMSTGTKSHQLIESKHEIESWLHIIAINILWKKESKCTEAFTLCTKAIGINSSHMNTILTKSPKSHAEKDENADRVSSLKKLNKILQDYESTLAQECDDDDGDGDGKKDDVSEIDTTPFVHKDKMDDLHRRMEFNKKRLESLNISMDFKANMINFNLIDVNHSLMKNGIENGTFPKQKQKKRL